MMIKKKLDCQNMISKCYVAIKLKNMLCNKHFYIIRSKIFHCFTSNIVLRLKNVNS